jgi:hypothetical protein
MLTVRTIMPLVPGLKKKTAGQRPAPMFPPAQKAPPELMTARLAICDACQYNREGICRQCCGGVPVATLVKLTASRCGRNYWKE